MSGSARLDALLNRLIDGVELAIIFRGVIHYLAHSFVRIFESTIRYPCRFTASEESAISPPIQVLLYLIYPQ